MYCMNCGMTRGAMESATRALGVTWAKHGGACCEPRSEGQRYPVMGRGADGETVWYTGRAGKEFVSHDPKDAFTYGAIEGARNRAKSLNVGAPIHGIWFVAPTGDVLEQFSA